MSGYHQMTKDTDIGWKVCRIKDRNRGGITLDTGFSCGTPDFMKDAKIGELWAVLHEKKPPFVLGAICAGVKLEDAQSSPSETIAKVHTAIKEYHQALTDRAHGGVAADVAIKKIEQALGVHWNG